MLSFTVRSVRRPYSFSAFTAQSKSLGVNDTFGKKTLRACLSGMKRLEIKSFTHNSGDDDMHE